MKRALVVGGVVLGLALLWLGVPQLLRRLAFFQIRRIELVGGRYLTAAEVARALRLRRDASVFDPLGALPARVRSLPGVLGASVNRRLPGTLRITVQEAEPVALTPSEGKLALMDRRGRVLPFNPTRSAADLPVAVADPEVASLVDRVRESDPGLFQQVVSVARERGAVVLEAGGPRLLLRADASVGEIRALGAVAAELTRRGTPFRELDARFAGRIVVRGKGA